MSGKMIAGVGLVLFCLPSKEEVARLGSLRVC